MELEKAKRLIEDLESALSDMVFAYINKDIDYPHDFEITALKKAAQLLPNNEILPVAICNIEKLERS